METLTRIAEPVVQSKGLEIWGIEVLQAGRSVVRIYVDVPSAARAAASAALAANEPVSPDAASVESVSIDQCAEISRMVGLALEVEDVFASAYVLEVSSPGLSRAFFRPEQMLAHVGDTVEVVLNEAVPDYPGRKKFRGRLQSLVGDRLTLLIEAGAEHEAGTLDVTWDQVRKAARVHVFLDPEKPGKKRKENK